MIRTGLLNLFIDDRIHEEDKGDKFHHHDGREETENSVETLLQLTLCETEADGKE